MKIVARLDAANFYATMERMAEATHRTVAAVLTQQARLAAEEWINIQPAMDTFTGKGTFAVQKKMQENAIRSDVYGIYVGYDDVRDDLKARHHGLDKGFVRRIKRGLYAEAEHIMLKYGTGRYREARVKPFDDAAYKAWRSPRTGRISIKRYPRVVVTDPKALHAFVKKLFQKVGWLKAGSVAAAEAIGIKPRGIPQWIRRHSAPGTGQKKLEGWNQYVAMTNLVSYAARHNKMNRLLEIVIGNRTRDMQRMIKDETFKAWSAAARGTSVLPGTMLTP